MLLTARTVQLLFSLLENLPFVRNFFLPKIHLGWKSPIMGNLEAKLIVWDKYVSVHCYQAERRQTNR